MNKKRKKHATDAVPKSHQEGSPTICLSMIVKDEADVIERCLESVKPFIDSWVIVDTGSTDGTQEIIKKTMSDIPGELFERPWVDFGTNRSQAIELARGRADYQFFIDADDSLELPEGWRTPLLGTEAYMMSVKRRSNAFLRIALVKDTLPWRFEGVLHEYPTADRDVKTARLDGPLIVSRNEGDRSRDPERYSHDAEVFERELAKDPSNVRNVFYLAQSYRDAGELQKAMENYQKRATLGGWDEEVWYSLFQVAALKERLGYAPGEVIVAYLEAYESRPQRAESLTALARFQRERKQFRSAHIFSREAVNTKLPTDTLFIDESVYQWRAVDEHAVSAYWVGHYDESRQLCEALLASATLPVDQRGRIKENLEFAKKKLAEEAHKTQAVRLQEIRRKSAEQAARFRGVE